MWIVCQQIIHMKYQALFSLKKKRPDIYVEFLPRSKITNLHEMSSLIFSEKKNRWLSATIMLGTFRIYLNLPGSYLLKRGPILSPL